MKRVSHALMVTATLCALLHGAMSATVAAPQRQRRKAPARPRPRVSTGVDYTKFLHTTRQHQAACVTCHKIPTSNWKKIREYPDVADYPDHNACVSCHRPQFFKGPRPPICSICHAKVSPRDDVRFSFRNPAGRRQFLVAFPHDRHQDVIAKLFRTFPVSERQRFVRASFTSFSMYAEDKTQHFNNCEICHGPRPTPPVAPASGWMDGFVPDNLTLKSVPVSHASCFSCHWKSEQPVKENCAGCHKLPDPPATIAVTLLPLRKSIKFRHGNEKHIQECTTCHINITKASSLKGLKPDVPITSCATSSCHNNPSGHQEIAKELDRIQKDKQFLCSYCHTSDVGRRDAPRGHYLSVEMTPSRREENK